MAGTASQLRICYVSAEYPTTDAPDVGRQLFELCRRLEIPSLLVVGRRGEPLPPPPHATLHAVPFTDALLGAHRGVRLAGAAAFKAAAFSLFFARSAKRVAGFRPAVVHVETPMPMLHALFARHALGAKVSLSLVGSDVRRVERSRLLQALVRQADVVVPVSPHMRDIATRWLPEARVRVIPNAVDGGLFRPLDVERRPQFLTPAAFIWEKGHDVLLPAFGQVVRRFPEAQLLLAGAGYREQAVRAQCDELGLAGQVRFLGRVRHPNLVQLFNESLACVLSSRSEGFPRVLLESLACGTPVIATRVGGCADLIGDAGVLVPAGDVSALAEAMIAMLASPDRQRRLADVCRARSALFDHDTRAEAFRELFSSLVDRQPA